MKIFCATLALVLLITLASFAASVFGEKAPGNLRESGRGWPACAPNQKQFSGYFDINVTTNKHYFYWFIESKVKTNKLIVWLTGGPGCSSQLALLAENGPCHMNETTGDLYQNPWSWTNEANVIWLDQPAGVGYSYSDQSGMDTGEKEVGFDNNAFVQNFLAAHPEMITYDFFVVGESYGGHYAPATASAIHKYNKAGINDVKVNLQGLATGNGLVAPVIQYQYYEELAYNWCQVVRPDHQPCVSKFSAEMMNASIPSCVKACKECDEGSGLACELGQGECNEGQMGPYEQTGLNPYDVTQECKYPPLCYDFKQATAFFNRADVKASLGADPSITWESCNMQVNRMFSGDWLKRYDLLIPPMMEDGIRYLNYAGDYDFICNWLGNQAVALQLPWSGKTAFNNAPFQEWTGPQGQTFGHVRSVATSKSPIHMNFIRVAKAGHMVPLNQPEAASYMINAFINNKKFV